MIHLIFKQNRLFVPLWLLGMVTLIVGVAPMLPEMFPTDADRRIISATMENPAMIALCGPGFDFEIYGNGAMFAQMMLVWCAAIWAVMNILFVVRHTRKDEEEGRLELIQALPVKRGSWLLSVISFIVTVNIILSLIIGFGLSALKVDDILPAGSFIFGACIGAAGIFFAAAALMLSQFCSTSKGAASFSYAVLGATFMLRAIGDISMESLSYFSPLGLLTRTEVFVNNYLWPVIIVIAISALLIVLTVILNSLRDLNQGIVPAKSGRTHAGFLLGTGIPGLTIRLLRSTLIFWALAVFILAASYGSIFGDIESFMNSNDLVRQLFMGLSDTGMTAVDINMQFVDTLMLIMAIISSIAVITVVFRLRTEEKRGRIDCILSQNLSRTVLITAYVAVAFIYSLILQILTVLGLWSTSSLVMETVIDFTDILKSGFAYIPAMLIFAGLATFFAGLLPKGSVIVWVYLAYAFIADYLGVILDLPRWAIKLTPFGFTPAPSSENFAISNLLILCIVAATLCAIGIIGFRRRDIR